jgi:hypothetical protein
MQNRRFGPRRIHRRKAQVQVYGDTPVNSYLLIFDEARPQGHPARRALFGA